VKVLHVLSQRPSLTGSGVTLDALVRCAATAGWQQTVVVGTPSDDSHPDVAGLPHDRVFPLRFGDEPLPFPVPGMSDVMPYASTRFGAMSTAQLVAYRSAWRRHLELVIAAFRPDVIHSHHVWLVSSLLKDVGPSIPVVTHCHATGLRQMELVPALAPEVCRGCARNDAFVVLHRHHAEDLERALAVSPDRIHVVGAGYRDDLFHAAGRAEAAGPSLLYIGKYSAAKGLPCLLDAFETISETRPNLRLHVAGDGAGPEADELRSRMLALHPGVVLHGHLGQPRLAELMRRCEVCVLPSFFEGVPLVLVEALACGCRLVATDLPGVATELAPRLGEALETVEPPAMATVDRPRPEAVPSFVRRLETALDRTLDAPPPRPRPEALEPFTWRSVFGRVENVWRAAIGSTAATD
jgi:glycosyltransferase involved in cell wall biosynthesis